MILSPGENREAYFQKIQSLYQLFNDYLNSIVTQRILLPTSFDTKTLVKLELYPITHITDHVNYSEEDEDTLTKLLREGITPVLMTKFFYSVQRDVFMGEIKKENLDFSDNFSIEEVVFKDESGMNQFVSKLGQDNLFADFDFSITNIGEQTIVIKFASIDRKSNYKIDQYNLATYEKHIRTIAEESRMFSVDSVSKAEFNSLISREYMFGQITLTIPVNTSQQLP